MQRITRAGVSALDMARWGQNDMAAFGARLSSVPTQATGRRFDRRAILEGALGMDYQDPPTAPRKIGFEGSQ